MRGTPEARAVAEAHRALRELMKSSEGRAWTQEGFAERAGLTRLEVVKFESGVNAATTEQFRAKLARGWGVTAPLMGALLNRQISGEDFLARRREQLEPVHQGSREALRINGKNDAPRVPSVASEHERATAIPNVVNALLGEGGTADTGKAKRVRGPRKGRRAR